MSATLVVDELRTSFPTKAPFSSEDGRVPIVDRVSFEVGKGEVLALVGESGCGKSMTALSLMRLVPRPGRIDHGRVLLSGKDILPLSVPEMRRIRGRGISMIFQEPMTSLNAVVKCGAQVVEAIRLHEDISKQAARERTLELFGRVGIPDAEARLDAYPHQLSGGLKQRVMIAMALSTRPKLLIADEPTTALDVTIQAQILQLMRELRRDFETSVLLITHDLGVVNELADRVAVMYAGRLIEIGTRDEVLGTPQHPYTQGLLAAMPSRSLHGQRLHEIPGVVPQPHQWPKGCRFCTRCPKRLDVCDEVVPGVTQLSETHATHCHYVRQELER